MGINSCHIINPGEIQWNTLYPACQLVSILWVSVTRLPFNTRRNNSTNKTSGIYSYSKQCVLDHTVHFPLGLVNCAFCDFWFFFFFSLICLCSEIVPTTLVERMEHVELVTSAAYSLLSSKAITLFHCSSALLLKVMCVVCFFILL